MNYYKNFLLVFWSFGVLVSCSDNEAAVEDPLIAHCDSTANPAENFFYYANGAWLNKILFLLLKTAMGYLKR